MCLRKIAFAPSDIAGLPHRARRTHYGNDLNHAQIVCHQGAAIARRWHDFSSVILFRF